MERYRELYFKLFDAQTKAIELLVKAQQETEQILIDDDRSSLCEPVVHEKEEA